MIAYRVTLPKYSGAADAVNGIGAAEVGGRWNFRGTRCLYCGEKNKVAIAEVGFYKLILPVLDFRLKGLEGHLAKCNGLKLKLIRLNLPFAMRDLPSVATPSDMLKYANAYRVELSFEEALRSDWSAIEGWKTAYLAHLLLSKENAAFITQSARTSGRCVVVFPDCLKTGKMIRKADEQDIEYWFATNKGIWDGKDPSQIETTGVFVRRVKAGKIQEEFVPIRIGGAP